LTRRKVDRRGQHRTGHNLTPMPGVHNGGQHVSATRFAELTGMSRERLRTWERRYGFPQPLRMDGGPRRYAIDDIPRVIGVRRAAESGVPIPRAIAGTRYADPGDGVSPAAFTALVEHAPVPVVAMSGPAPLRVEYVNATLRVVAGAPRAGEELAVALPPFGSSPAVSVLRHLFATDGAPAEIEHPSWDGHPRRTARSVAFRLPVEPGERPLVALVGLEGDGERAARAALAEQGRELERLRRRDERHTRWLDAIATLAGEFQREPGPAVIDNGLDVVIRRVNAVDGALARYLTGQLVLPGSRRGLLDPAVLTVAAHPDLARGLRDAEPVWLDRAVAARLGVPRDLHASGVPVVVAGEPLGLIVLLFNEVEPHDADNTRLLAAVSAAMGFALLRDRLASELREAAGPD
jgi:hypothetical protein